MLSTDKELSLDNDKKSLGHSYAQHAHNMRGGSNEKSKSEKKRSLFMPLTK
jgi:hypothetical protein